MYLKRAVLAVRAVAEVALHEHDFFGDLDHLLRRAEADDIGEARIGCLVAVGGPHAAADGDVETGEFAVFDDGDERQAVGEDIDIVRGRHRDGDLELARQIGLAVDRLDLLLAAGDFLVIEPDFVIGAGLRREVVGDVAGPA